MKNIINKELETKFKTYCETLSKETRYMSVQRYDNPNYIGLISLGKDILPFVKEVLFNYDINSIDMKKPHPLYFFALIRELLKESPPEKDAVKFIGGFIAISVSDMVKIYYDFLVEKGY